MWICPTLGRPERLQELAKSWNRMQPDTKLIVRLWDGDVRLEAYSKLKWPATWHFYTSSKKYLGPTLNEFFEAYKEEETYGFIADDVVLRTPSGLEHLEAMAAPFYIAYPNDCLQRYRLCTHFCIGGELVRELGWFALPDMLHMVDMPWYNIGRNTGLIRYCAQVIFQHKHFLTGTVEKDDTYSVTYRGNVNRPNSQLYLQDHGNLKKWLEKGLALDAIKALRVATVMSEDWDEWEAQDKVDALIVPEMV